jgi:hypothetical protein
MGSWNQGRPWATGIIFASFLAFSVPHANATIITDGCVNANVTCTLEELSGGASIEVDGVLFDTWFVDDASNNSVDLGSVDVVPLVHSSNVGLAFATNGAMVSTGVDDFVDVYISFAATAFSDARQISGVSFELTDFIFGAGNLGGIILGSENVLDSSGDQIGEADVVADNPPLVLELFDLTTFEPTSTVVIEKQLLIGDVVGDTVTLNGFEQRFQLAAVPTPIPLILLFSGLLSLAWFRRSSGYTRESLR